MVLDPDKEEEAEAIFRKWGLDFAVIGKTTDTKRFVIKHKGEVKADLPIKELGDEAPLYDRPHQASPKLPVVTGVAAPTPNGQALLTLIGSPDLCSKRWVWEQYDHLILGNSVQQPGGDAGIVRIGEGPKGLAFTTDVTQRYCEADPFEGGKQAVAEAWRNLTAVGATPLAITDNLNFGNPERPHFMGQLVGCLKGIGEACKALDFPVVSGNVSLYNETEGRGILPTPSIGGVGLVKDVTKAATLAFREAGDAILLVGETTGWLGQSVYLRDVCGREEGAPPLVDLAVERRNGEAVRALIADGAARAVHDLSDGGLAVALAESCMARGVGATIEAPAGVPAHEWLFGEDQGRYIVAVEAAAAQDVLARLGAAGVPATAIGVTGGDALALPGEAPLPVADLRKAHESWLPTYMGGEIINS